MSKTLAFGFACIVLSLAACSGHDAPSLGAETHPEWVATDPIQCDGNPWEVDWLAAHPGEVYPGHGSKDLLPQDVVTIITGYYAARGIGVLSARAAAWPDPVTCDACTCPAGWTLYLLVKEADVPAMLALGFRREAPKSP